MTALNELPTTVTSADEDLLLIQQGGGDRQITKGDLFVENVHTIVDATTVDINPANGGIQVWTLGASRTATATAFVQGQSVTLMITAGSNTITWPTMNWVGGDEPTLSSTEQTVVELWKVGSTLYGALVGDVA